MKKDDEKVFMGMDESESYLHQTQVLLRLLLAIDSCFISISVFL